MTAAEVCEAAGALIATLFGGLVSITFVVRAVVAAFAAASS